MLMTMRTRLTSSVVLATVLLTLACGWAGAQALDPTSQEALASVLRMLQDPVLRTGLMAGNTEAGKADQQIQSLTGGSATLTQEVYELAGQIFEDLVRGSGGDEQVVSQALTRAQADPASFAAMLSPGTLERLRTLAVKLSDRPRH
jgi:hypothetical protein